MRHTQFPPPPPSARRRSAGAIAAALAVALAVGATGARGGPTIEISAASPSAVLPPAQQLDQLLQRRLPGQSGPVIARARKAFLDHLTSASPIVAEEFSSGRMSADDLGSRVDIFLADHPEFSGAPAPLSPQTPQQRVAELLGAAPDLARSEAERSALVGRFMGSLDGTSLAELNSGRMTTDQLRSRTDVFIGDLRAAAARVTTDPAIAAAGPIVDAFVQANYGSVTERADSICYRGTRIEKGVTREFVIFKKRPNLLRIHLVQDDLVVGLLGYDGTTAWTERIGRAAETAAPGAADDLVRTAQFDDPLVGYTERGAVVRVQDRPANGPIRLQILEKDGTESVVTIDPVTNHQVALRRRLPGEPWKEIHFSDFRKVGSATIAFVQEDWKDGAVTATTRFSAVQMDPGLLNHFFDRPTSVAFDYMDFMNGLAVLKSRQQAGPAAAPSISLAR